jgi:acyl carrier protein
VSHTVDPRIATIVREVGSLPDSWEPAPDQRLKDDLGIDSLQMIDIVVAVEEELGVEFGDEAMRLVSTIGDIERLAGSAAR